MISPLRRKRPTTRPNTRPPRATASSKHAAWGCALGLALAGWTHDASADQLQWRARSAPSGPVQQAAYESAPLRSVITKKSAPAAQPVAPRVIDPAVERAKPIAAQPKPAVAQTAPTSGLQWQPIRPARPASPTTEEPRNWAQPAAAQQETAPIDPFEEELGLPPFEARPTPAAPLEAPQLPPAVEEPSTPLEGEPRVPELQPTPEPAEPQAAPPQFGAPPQDDSYYPPPPTPAVVETADDCQDAWQKLQAKGLPAIGLEIELEGVAGEDFPAECLLVDTNYDGRDWACTEFLWKASALCHKPLYFEETALERYGHTVCPPVLQPLVSGAHFFGTLPILPYKMGLKPPKECVYALGYYRPGNCAPYMISPLGFTPRAALAEAGAVVGAAAVIP